MRLDNYLVEKGFFESRTKAKQSIERGEVLIDNKLINKPSFDIQVDCEVKLVYDSLFVSLGGFKLEKALNDFGIDVNGLIVADIGASTGGFTDCLLKRGAKNVFAVDLRDDLLHQTLKSNSKVKMVVKNAKELSLSDFDMDLDMIVADLSFISVKSVLPIFHNLLRDGKKAIILIKPQFETGRKTRYKNGIVRDQKVHQTVCREVYDFAISCNLAPQGFTIAPLVSGKNKEFLILLEKGGEVKLSRSFYSEL